jgi:hypothetical protein
MKMTKMREMKMTKMQENLGATPAGKSVRRPLRENENE